MFFKFILLLLQLTNLVALNTIKVNPVTQGFVDNNSGRHIIFHGVNAVYKVAPWHPNIEGFDPINSLSLEDAINIHSWGFNVLRLGVMWPGVEIQRGVYNETYLDQIEIIVKNLLDQEIYVILDFHQDLLHRKYCGEGYPDYVYDICVKNQPINTRPFPRPAVNETYPVDANGDPEFEACLSQEFARYYLSDEVGNAFQCLYDNVEDLWEAIAGYWMKIASRFKNYNNVLGYELINEPWAGNVAEEKKRLFPGRAEQWYLQPLYQYLHKRIRTVDDEKLIFYEGLTIDYFPNGFTATPGGEAYNDRQVYAYHIYCLEVYNEVEQIICDALDDAFFYLRNRDAKRLGGGMMMTEFGASQDVRGNLHALDKNCALADRHQQSWAYWQFKYFQDLTTQTPVGESLYNPNGTVVVDKLKILCRTYPQTIAGNNFTYKYSFEEAKFDLTMKPLESIDIQNNPDGATTIIYFNREYIHPNGVQVTIDGSSDYKITCGTADSKLDNSGLIYITQQIALPSDSSISITVTSCRGIPTASCTCA